MWLVLGTLHFLPSIIFSIYAPPLFAFNAILLLIACSHFTNEEIKALGLSSYLELMGVE